MKRAIVLLALAGCSGPAPEQYPWAREPVEYRPTAEPDLPKGPIPIDLPTVLRLAGANSLDLAYVRQKLHEAYAHARIAEQQFWPVISPQYRFIRHEGLTQSTPGALVDVDKQRTELRLVATLEWEVGEAIFSALSASRRYDAGRSRLEAAEQEVLLEAAETYYDLVLEYLRARVAGESAAVAGRLAAELDAAVKAGRGFRGDMLRARVQERGSRLRLLRAQEAIQLASIRLESLLRLEPGTGLVPVEARAEFPRALALVDAGAKEGTLLDEALDTRPEVREAMAELSAAEQDESGATWAPLIPSLRAEAAPGRMDETLSDLESTEDYAVALGWRIGPGGLFDFGRSRLTSSRTRQAEIHLERVKQQVSDEVRSALARLRAKGEQRTLAGEVATDAAEALRLNQERQTQNIGLPLEVLHAEEALARARMDLFAAIVELNQAQLAAFTAIGRRHPKEPK